jgi:hypothetical protein
MNPPSNAAREEARILIVMRDAEMVERDLDDLRRLHASLPEGAPAKAAALAAIEALALAMNAITKLGEELVRYSPAPPVAGVDLLAQLRAASASIKMIMRSCGSTEEDAREATASMDDAIAKAGGEA